MRPWLLYRNVLAVAAVLLFFTGLSDFLLAKGVASTPPLYALVALIGLSLPLVFTPGTAARVVASPVVRWGAFYAAFSALAFMWSSQSDVAWAELRWRVLAVLLLGALTLVFADPRVHHTTRVAIVGTVVLGIGLNVVDVLRPLTFSPIVGRAAGLHVNPNSSAIALVLGMLMTIEVVPPKLRPWLVTGTGLGVLLTLSRGGALLWVLVAGMILAFRVTKVGSLLRVGLGVGAVAVTIVVLTGWWTTIVGLAELATSGAWNRFRVGPEMIDGSTEVRLGAAQLAWWMFLDRPALGWGVGATAEWDWSESTHNIYLRHLAEYGIGGIVIVPLLVWAIARPVTPVRPRTAIWLSVVVLIWGVFSHNILDERHFLIAIALVAAMYQWERERVALPAAGAPAVEAAP